MSNEDRTPSLEEESNIKIQIAHTHTHTHTYIHTDEIRIPTYKDCVVKIKIIQIQENVLGEGTKCMLDVNELFLHTRLIPHICVDL